MRRWLPKGSAAAPGWVALFVSPPCPPRLFQQGLEQMLWVYKGEDAVGYLPFLLCWTPTRSNLQERDLRLCARINLLLQLSFVNEPS